MEKKGDVHRHVAFLLCTLPFWMAWSEFGLTFSPKRKKTKKYFKKCLTKTKSGDIISRLSRRSDGSVLEN
jgi:hypothetical protein